MKTNFKLLFLIVIFNFFSCTSSDNENIITDDEIQFTTPEWAISLGRDTTIPFFPDAKSNYFSYAFQRNSSDDATIKLSGKFPNARYFSIVLYNNDTRDPIAIMRDYEISPSQNSLNPFQEESYISNQEYEIHIGPNLNELQNSINYDSNVVNLSIFIRYYLPEQDDFGAVDLPTISAINSENNPIQAPAAESLEDLVEFDDIVSTIELLNEVLFFDEPESDRYFFRGNSDASGNYANPDNDYLINASTLIDNNVILLRWKAPTFSPNFSVFSTYNMRYYSVSLANQISYNFVTLSDSELYVAEDGFINLVISRGDQEISDHSMGLNYITWPEEIGDKGFILYRNMLTNSVFQNSIIQCPSIGENFVDFLIDSEPFDARHFIGDFAPSGKLMSKTDFINDFGGIEVSY